MRFSKVDNKFYTEFVKKENEAMKKKNSSSFVSGAAPNFSALFDPIREPKSGRLDPRPVDPMNKVKIREFEIKNTQSELDQISQLFSKTPEPKKPEKIKKKLFIEGNFRKADPLFQTKQAASKSAMNMGEAFFKERNEAILKEAQEAVKKNKKKKRVFKIKDPKIGQKVKNWYSTYVKREKPAPKPKVEESWISEKDANRMRVLAGLPEKHAPKVVEVKKRTRWERFRIFSFRQLSLLIWRIHPDAKVTTTVTKPKIDFKRTEDIDFLMKFS